MFNKYSEIKKTVMQLDLECRSLREENAKLKAEIRDIIKEIEALKEENRVEPPKPKEESDKKRSFGPDHEFHPNEDYRK